MPEVRQVDSSSSMEKGTLLHCWWECKLVQSLWRTGWRFLKKLEIKLPYAAMKLKDAYSLEGRL